MERLDSEWCLELHLSDYLLVGPFSVCDKMHYHNIHSSFDENRPLRFKFDKLEEQINIRIRKNKPSL